MKIFYRLIATTFSSTAQHDEDGSQPITRSALVHAEEDLVLPFTEAEMLRLLLEESEDLLPRRRESRVFSLPNASEQEEWRVGLLRRF